jgi:uncharacterized protein YciI
MVKFTIKSLQCANNLFFLAALFMASLAFAQTNYDSTLAKKVGADEYGMKQYVMVFLKHTNAKIDSAQMNMLMQGHLKNIGRLAREGKLVVAGPFLDGGNLAGIFIFNVRTVEEARALVATDPAVQAGVFEMEMHPWYGSAALTQVVPLHRSLQKKNITD